MTELIGAFIGGWSHIFMVNTFMMMVLGIAIGFIVGILPGLGGPATLALMLPFTFKMQPFDAFAFLLGMTAVTARREISLPFSLGSRAKRPRPRQ